MQPVLKCGWWTGEDSNLRSPQGAADLQSAGFSHSPTRPERSWHFTLAVTALLLSPGAMTNIFQLRCEPDCLLQNWRKSMRSKNTKRARVRIRQPVDFYCPDSLRLIPRKNPCNVWWSWRRELNPRPSDYKSDALPAELRQHAQTE